MGSLHSICALSEILPSLARATALPGFVRIETARAGAVASTSAACGAWPTATGSAVPDRAHTLLGVWPIGTANEVHVLAGPCPEQALEVGGHGQGRQVCGRVGVPAPKDVGVHVAEGAE